MHACRRGALDVSLSLSLSLRDLRVSTFKTKSYVIAGYHSAMHGSLHIYCIYSIHAHMHVCMPAYAHVTSYSADPYQHIIQLYNIVQCSCDPMEGSPIMSNGIKV